MRISERRSAAARANGRKSKGPVTPEGKARSSVNSFRHGLTAPGALAESICLSNEMREDLSKLLASFVAQHAPSNDTEHLIVQEMAVARWRLQRSWVMESALMDNQMDRMFDDLANDYETMDEPTRATLAFRELAETSPSLALLQRYETRLSRQFDRCLKRLNSLKEAAEKAGIVILPIEPKNGELLHADELPEPVAAECAEKPVASAEEHRKPAIPPAQPSPQVDGIHSGPRRNDPEPEPGPPPSLPRAA